MKKTKFISSIIAAALALTNLAVMNVSADEVNLDGTYHAYIGVQSASYTFRNAYDDATYGYGTTSDDGVVWFDQLTGWDTSNNPVHKPTTFVDAEIAGNGTYTVSMSDFDFGEDEAFNLLFVSTDMPINETIKITDIKCRMDGGTKYTFDEAFMDPDAKEYTKWLILNQWNNELTALNADAFYTMPVNSIEVEFTVSGFNYYKAVEEAPVEEETTAEITEAVTEPTTEAATEAATTTATSATEDTAEESSFPIAIVVIAIAVVVIVVIIIVVSKKKS